MRTTRRQALLSTTAFAAAAMLRAPAIALGASAQTAAYSRPDDPELLAAVSLSDFESIAYRRMELMAWEYINSGAADEITLRWNREAFDKIRLNPRVLRDIPKLDTRTTVLGHELPFPVILAPTALHKLAHPSGEVGTVQGAGAAHAAMVLSTMSSVAMEEVAKNAS